MISISDMEAILTELAEELPKEFYRELNGGIVLLPKIKLHKSSVAKDLYILAEYHYNRSMGRYIVFYYGSFRRTYSHLSSAQLKEKLKDTLHHEFTHHLESLAGERGLEIKDEQKLAKYLKKHGRI